MCGLLVCARARNCGKTRKHSNRTKQNRSHFYFSFSIRWRLTARGGGHNHYKFRPHLPHETEVVMSRLSDYSRFDHLDDEDDGSSDGGGTSDAASARGPATSRPASGGAVSQPAAPAMTTRKNADGRYVFECDGRKIYEWEQSLDGKLPPAGNFPSLLRD